jgi:hypothetical protein
VAKSWRHWEGRTFLVEELPVQTIKSQLEQLPVPASAGATASSANSLRHKVSAVRLLPPTRLVQNSTNAVQWVKADLNQTPGVVLDYVTIDSGSNTFTFQAGETYLVTGPVAMGDGSQNGSSVIFQGGAVIKFTADASGGIYFDPADAASPTDPGHPVILTSKDDNTVGATIEGSTGTPITLTNVTFLPNVGSICALRCFDFRYAGIALYAFDPIFVYNCRFFNCYQAIQTSWGEVDLYNCLFSKCNTAIAYNFDPGEQNPREFIVAENVTADEGTYFLTGDAGSLPLGYDWFNNFTYYFYNCLFTRYEHGYAENTGWDPFAEAVYQLSSASCYQTAGNAHFYLAANSPYRDIGATNYDSCPYIGPGNYNFLKTMTTCAPQNGGWPDTNQIDIGYHYPTNEDSECDGLPDRWEWKFFGDFSQTGSGDADGDGVSNLEEYLNGTDPNQINFTVRLGNQQFNTNNVTGSYLVLNGVPSYEAVLAGTDDLSSAVWSNYDGIVHLPLGSTNGVYQVWMGLKGHAPDAAPVWMGTRVTLNRIAPQIFITNPATNVVAQPYLQLQGYSDKPLASITYDLTNASGIFTNQEGHITGHTLDTNTLEYTSDYFQCYDLLLTNGVNAITLYATDPAGNTTTTNLSVTLDYASATNPAIQITWPADGMKISGNSITLRGWTEDASAVVAASITDTNGNTTTVNGTVERNGKLWVKDLPLSSGTNTLTLMVTNSAGLSSVTNINVSQASLVLTIYPVAESLWHPWVTVNGYISDATQAVWVNGVKATVTPRGDGTADWTATHVPVTEGGVASFDMTAYEPDEQQPDGSYGNGGGN